MILTGHQLYVYIFIGIILFMLLVIQIGNYKSIKKNLWYLLKKEVSLNKEFYRLFNDNPMNRIGSITNSSPYSSCYRAKSHNNYGNFTNYQMNKCVMEQYTNYSLENRYLELIWNKIYETNSPYTATFILHCDFIMQENKFPILTLSDPYNTITTEPLKGLSIKKAESLLNKLLIVELTFYKKNSTEVLVKSIKDTIYTMNNCQLPKSVYFERQLIFK